MLRTSAPIKRKKNGERRTSHFDKIPPPHTIHPVGAHTTRRVYVLLQISVLDSPQSIRGPPLAVHKSEEIMPVNNVAEQVFGIVGTICWTGQIIPQIWKSWRSKETEGLSHWLMFIWGIASVFIGIFAIVQNLNIPLIIQPQLFGFLSIVSWSQCLYYDHKRPKLQVITILIVTLAVLGGFEAGMVFAIRPAVNKGNERPVTFFGIMASIIIAAGLFPQYWEIMRFREVKGISILFIVIDTLGGVFSLLSLVFKEKFDVLAGIEYSLVVVLDSVVIILAIILNPRAERRRRRLAQEADTHDEEMTTPSGNEAHSRDDQPTLIDSGISSRRNSLSRRTSPCQSEKADIEGGISEKIQVSD